MRRAEVFVHNISAGFLEEIEKGGEYRFIYHADYIGESVSLTMPIEQNFYASEELFPFFEGLLPEGPQLEALLRISKIDRDDRSEVRWISLQISGLTHIIYKFLYQIAYLPA